MSSLTDTEKRYLEKILDMSNGYVLDYTDLTFDEFFRRYKIDIHSQKYQTIGTSKAKKMRAFWNQEPDSVVAKVLLEMLASYIAKCEIQGSQPDKTVLAKCKAITTRLSRGLLLTDRTESIDNFLNREFDIPNLHKLPIDDQMADIIKSRLQETHKSLEVGAYLGVIFLCGSVLEGVLLSVAKEYPEKFNRSTCSPKTPDGKSKPFNNWSLAQLINTSYEVGLLKLDVKQFSHVLRDFRNFIHPYEQMKSQFSPDEDTAKICFQVLKAALTNLAGDR
jgi:hypothetical protein